MDNNRVLKPFHLENQVKLFKDVIFLEKDICKFFEKLLIQAEKKKYKPSCIERETLVYKLRKNKSVSNNGFIISISDDDKGCIDLNMKNKNKFPFLEFFNILYEINYIVKKFSIRIRNYSSNYSKNNSKPIPSLLQSFLSLTPTFDIVSLEIDYETLKGYVPSDKIKSFKTLRLRFASPETNDMLTFIDSWDRTKILQIEIFDINNLKERKRDLQKICLLKCLEENIKVEYPMHCIDFKNCFCNDFDDCKSCSFFLDALFDCQCEKCKNHPDIQRGTISKSFNWKF